MGFVTNGASERARNEGGRKAALVWFPGLG